ncbi:EAL domain-containing protein [Reinekea forsetii]|nr:EAL domain-containing protein [Reinekea forsetii]
MTFILTIIASVCLVAILLLPSVWINLLLTILGVASLIYVVQKSPKMLFPGFALIMALIVVPVTKWYLPALLKQSTSVLESKIETEFDVIESTLQQFFFNNSAALDSLNLLIANEEVLTDRVFQNWMKQLLPDYRNNYLNIAISEDLIAKHVYPKSEANLKVLARNLGETPNMGFVYHEVLKTNVPGIIGPVDLIQGVPGVIRVVPVEGKPNVIISGVLSLQSLKEQLIPLVSESSKLSIAVTGYADPYYLVNQAEPKKSILKRVEYQDIKVDIYIQSDLLQSTITRTRWTSYAVSFLAWLLLTSSFTWQRHSIRLRDQQRSAILENKNALIEAQRLGQLGSWRQSGDDSFKLSEPLQSLIGVMKETIALKDLDSLVHPSEHKKVQTAFEELSSGKLTRITTQHRLRVGERYRWFEHRIARSEDGELTGIVRDIQTIKEQEKQVAKLEAFDPLTGASNRRHFHQLVSQNIALCDRRNTTLGLMLINIDDFRSVNEKYNQAVGDELLKLIASRLTTICRKTDFISRLGGDTFAVALVDVGTASQSVIAVENILRKLKMPYRLNNEEVFPQLTCGVALYPDDGLDFEHLLQRCEQTLSIAKTNKRGHYSFYSAELDSQTNRRQRILASLPSALKNDHFYIVFQPRVSSTGDHSSLSMEALVRWQDPELGFVSPGEFIPIAEGTSLIADIGTWVMNAAFSALHQYKDQLPRGLSISINLSPRQLEDTTLVSKVKQALDKFDIDPNCIELEVTEHSIAVESDIVLSNMKELNNLGFKFALDDFGTGYSNLSMLQSLPLHVLKIDMSFIRNIGFSDKSNELVRAIIDLGHTLGLHTVAEGVETIEQVSYLEKLGCEELQGFYFYKPAPIEELINRLA